MIRAQDKTLKLNSLLDQVHIHGIDKEIVEKLDKSTQKYKGYNNCRYEDILSVVDTLAKEMTTKKERVMDFEEPADYESDTDLDGWFNEIISKKTGSCASMKEEVKVQAEAEQDGEVNETPGGVEFF